MTKRLDLHLQQMHGVQKGQELQAAIKASRSRNEDTPVVAALEKCLSYYKYMIVSTYSMNIQTKQNTI